MENDIDIKGGYIMHELIAQPKMLLVVIVYLIALVGTGAYFAKKAAVTRYHSFLKRNMVLKLEQYQRLS